MYFVNATVLDMFKKAAFFVLILLFIIGVTCNGSFAGEVIHKTLPVGQEAPVFEGFTIDGEPFHLKKVLSEKNVILFFWSFFCGPCREEMPLIQQFYQGIEDQPIEIASVNLDETTLHTPIKNYLKSSGYTYPTIANKYKGQDLQLDKLYLVTGTPVVYMIKQDGTISFAHVGRLEFEDFKKAVQEYLLMPSN